MSPLDFAGPLLGVQAFDVALGADLEWRRNMHLDEADAVSLMRGPHLRARLGERRDHRRPAR